MNGHFLCAGDFQTTVPILSVMRGRFGHLPSVDVLVVVKIRFQKEMPEWSHCGFSRKAISLRQGRWAVLTIQSQLEARAQLLMSNTVFQRSSSSYHPSRQPAQEVPDYLESEFDRNQNTPYNEVRWSKEGNVDSPVQNLGHDIGHGCVCSKVLYAWK